MLFISHNSKDKKAAEELLARAIERGYSPFAYPVVSADHNR
jgi:hypothetical protein